MSKWDQYEDDEVVSSKWDQYEDDSIEEALETSDTSNLPPGLGTIPQGIMSESQKDTLAKSTLQGATGSLSDEVGGAGLTAWDKLMEYVPNTPQNVDAGLAEQGFKGDVDKSTLDRYKENRDQLRGINKAAEKANPGTYLVGEIGGGLLPAIASGGASAAVSVGKSALQQGVKQGIKQGIKAAPKLAAAGAGVGALEAAGRSEAELFDGEYGEFAKDIGTGAVLSAGTSLTLPLAGKAIKASKVFPMAAKVLKASSKKVGSILRGISDKAKDSDTFIRHIAKANELSSNGIEVIGKKAVSEKQQAEIRKYARHISERTKHNRQEANDMITEAFKDGDEGVRRLMDRMVKEQMDEINKLASRAATDEGKAAVKTFQEGYKNIQRGGLKEGVDPSVLGLKTEADAMQDMLSKQRADLSVRNPNIMDERAGIALDNKLAKKYTEGAIPFQENVTLPSGDSRSVKSALKIGEGGLETIDSQVVKPGKMSPIEKVKVDQDEFLRYGVDGQYKSQRIQPKDIFKDEPPKIQELFDLIRNFKETMPDKGGDISQELLAIEKTLMDNLKGALPIEKAKLLEDGYQQLQQVHSMKFNLGKDLGHKFTDQEDKAIDKLAKKLEQFHDMDLEGTDLTLPDIKRGLGKFSDLNVTGKETEAGLKDAAQRLLISEAGQGSEVVKVGAWNRFGIKTGAAVGYAGHKLKKLSKAPKNMIKGLAQKAGLAGDTKSANFFNSLAEKNSQGRAAVMFSVSQNPELKKTLESYLPEGEENE